MNCPAPVTEPFASEPTSHTTTAELEDEVASLRRQVAQLQASLANISVHAHMLHVAVPDAQEVPRAMAVGGLLFLAGLAEAALKR
jgi:hypothetical protein